jgi:AcrR family transcriptional regulator
MAGKPDPAPARDRLLKVATRLFIENGFAGTPVSRIVRESGVTMPVLYYHFGNKADLLRAVIEARGQWLRADHRVDPAQGFDEVCAALIENALQHIEDLRDGLRLRVLLSFETGANVATLRELTEEQRRRSLHSLIELFGAALPEASVRRCAWLSETYLSGVQALALELLGFTGKPGLLAAKGQLLRRSLADLAVLPEAELSAGLD